MNPFGSSGDDVRRGEGAQERSRYSSVNYAGSSQYHGDTERYSRGRSLDGRADVDRNERERYPRSQSREAPRDAEGSVYSRYRNSGSLDRFGQTRSRHASSQYGDVYSSRGYGDERVYRTEPGYGDRHGKYRELERSQKEPMGPRPEEFLRGERRYSIDGFGRSSQGPIGDRYGDIDRDRYMDPYFYDRAGYGSRYGYGDGMPFDRSHGERRYFQDRFDRMAREQPGRVRFDGDRERLSRSEVRRGSLSDAREGSLGRRGSERRDDEFRRAQSLPSRHSRDDVYRTETPSNLNSRNPSIHQEKQPINRSRRGSERDARMFEMQGGNQYRRGGQFSSHLGKDRMPPPIPPFSEPRSNYPSTLAVSRTDDDAKNRSRELAVRSTYELLRRRYYERAGDSSQNPTWLQRGAIGNSYNMSQISDDVHRVETVDFRAKENSKEHRTFDYELVRDIEAPSPVYRRGQTFFMDISLRDREFDDTRDIMHLNFYFGPNPSVPKHTRVALPIVAGTEFHRIPFQWDARITRQDGKNMTIEVNIPATCPVGMWRCVVETSSKEAPPARLQYRCPEDVYIIFNPFERDDAAYMENDEQRYEYVINDTGKVYTGGYRNVRGRPWIFGQFDDCVLPAACVLLEMSGLSHAERGNPMKVTRALASMIKANRSGKRTNSFENASSGLIEVKYEDSYVGGYTPHLWTGSVQIIEEFLKRGTSPVKYGQCWVMAALMTTLCRCLGLPSRPVTAFICAMETQNSLTIDRYIDHCGDIMENGPGRDQPDSLWSFHTWCDVYMHRPDQPEEYSGWQALDAARINRDFRDLISGSCGPCPIEALRRGDVGQRDDIDAFYASLNSYVRYFYEDDESGWGYSPFRQFRLPVSRYILTKSVGRFDDEGDEDCDDLTNVYRDNERTDEEKFTIFNSCRGIHKDTPGFEYQAAAFNRVEFNPDETDQRIFDVTFELDAPERVMIGQAVTIPVLVSNTSSEKRTIQTNICTRSTYYTGNLGPYLKKSSAQMTLEPNQQETVTLTLDSWDYEDKLVDMGFVKITLTGFVKETGQSYADEFDFRFNKPWLKIELDELKQGEESSGTFSFTNPLEVPLTDCFITMEMSGTVRPRTIRIVREVRPRENFSYSHTFVPRKSGERRLVASFASRQLSDVIGQRSVVVKE